jgi:ABC-type dipeptide/oligopeptide/nickel transport system ATPase subunit
MNINASRLPGVPLSTSGRQIFGVESEGTQVVSTLKTGYRRIQALSQDKEQSVHPRAATQDVASDHISLQRWVPELPRVPRPRSSPPC